MTKSQLFADAKNLLATGYFKEAFIVINELEQLELSATDAKLLLRLKALSNRSTRSSSSYFPYFSTKENSAKADICIVTPAFNSSLHISRTISSILVQDESVTIRYHIQDSCSTDQTAEIVRQYIMMVDRSHPNIHMSLAVEKDDGMYDGILKAFDHCKKQIAPGTWMTWINSDDQLLPDSARILREISQKYKEDVRFVVAPQFVRDDLGSHYTRIIPATRDTLSNGLHDGLFLPFVQQEGTFWKNSIWQANINSIFDEFKKACIANDYKLWKIFASNHMVFILDKPMGIFFRRHNHVQLSSNIENYYSQIDSYIPRIERSKSFEAIIESSADHLVLMLEVNEKTLEPSLVKRRLRLFGHNKYVLEDLNPILSKANHSRYQTDTLDNTLQMEYHAISNYLPYVNLPCLAEAREEFGIGVFTHTRTEHLELILKSISRQGYIRSVVVFIDGSQGKQELKQKTSLIRDICSAHGVERIVARNGLLGFRKSILDGLVYMIKEFNKFLILEDDCYPLLGGIDKIRSLLDKHESNERIFSVYGHRFEIENEDPYCSRFQGWGWATTRNKLIGPLAKLIYLYSLPENEYLDFTAKVLTQDIIDIIDVTSPRKPTYCLNSFFAWDETLTLICALEGKVHAPTESSTIINFGLDQGESDFDSKTLKFRQPPFNMYSLEEVKALASREIQNI